MGWIILAGVGCVVCVILYRIDVIPPGTFGEGDNVDPHRRDQP